MWPRGRSSARQQPILLPTTFQRPAHAALSYATLHAATSYEDVEINVKKRENSLVDIENPEERENLGHK